MRKSYDWESLGCLGWCLVAILSIVLLGGLIWFDVFLATLIWSAVAVPLFNLPVLTMWQMFGVKVLLWLLVPVRVMTSKSK